MKLILFILALVAVIFWSVKESKIHSNIHHFNFIDLVGDYELNREVKGEEYENGWTDTKQYKRQLILLEDSTYKEINTSFETFDPIDFCGKWELKGNVIKLKPQGTLDKSNDNWVCHEEELNKSHIDICLEILDDKSLKIKNDGNFTKEILYRISE